MRMVWCTFSVIGFHKYKGSPKEVAYLRQEHRHKFNFKVSVEVEKLNREIEFHLMRRDMLMMLRVTFEHDELTHEYNFEGRSCEMIADELMNRLNNSEQYNSVLDNETAGRQIIIEVNEDGECGGVISRY